MQVLGEWSASPDDKSSDNKSWSAGILQQGK